MQKRDLSAMNERDLKLTRKEIKQFSSLIQWQMVEIGQCYSVACTLTLCNLQSFIREKQPRSEICVEADNMAYFFHFNSFCTCLKNIHGILIARFATAFWIAQNSIVWFLNFCLLKRNKAFRTIGVCYEEERSVAMFLVLFQIVNTFTTPESCNRIPVIPFQSVYCFQTSICDNGPMNVPAKYCRNLAASILAMFMKSTAVTWS